MNRVAVPLLLLSVGAPAGLAAPIPSASAQTTVATCSPNAPGRLDFRFCTDSSGWVGGFADPPAPDARTDRDGNLWVLIGTGPGFKGRSTVHISHIKPGLRRQ